MDFITWFQLIYKDVYQEMVIWGGNVHDNPSSNQNDAFYI